MAERPAKRLRSVSYDGTEGSDDWPQGAKGTDVAPRQPSNMNMYVKTHRLFHEQLAFHPLITVYFDRPYIIHALDCIRSI